MAVEGTIVAIAIPLRFVPRQWAAQNPAAVITRQRQANGRCAEDKIDNVQGKQPDAPVSAVQNHAAPDLKKGRKIAHRIATRTSQEESDEGREITVAAEKKHDGGGPTDHDQWGRQVDPQQQDAVQLGAPAYVGGSQQGNPIAMKALRVANRPPLDLPAANVPVLRDLLIAFGPIDIDHLPAMNR